MLEDEYGQQERVMGGCGLSEPGLERVIGLDLNAAEGRCFRPPL